MYFGYHCIPGMEVDLYATLVAGAPEVQHQTSFVEVLPYLARDGLRPSHEL